MERSITWPGGRTWCRVVGDIGSGRAPVVIVHGGPAMTHDYLEGLGALSRTGRPVVFYDQIGAGRSVAAAVDAVNIDLLVQEFAAVVDGLRLRRVHLLGHSWGGMLGLEITAAMPQRITSAVYASTPPSTALLLTEWQRLMEALEPGAWAKIRAVEDAGATDDAEYQRITAQWSSTYFCRLQPTPEELRRSFDGMNVELYHRLWGPKEYSPSGELRTWDATGYLSTITVPCLLTSGRYDQETATCQRVLLDGLPNARWIEYPDSSHVPHLEEPREYLADVAQFFEAVDAEL